MRDDYRKKSNFGRVVALIVVLGMLWLGVITIQGVGSIYFGTPDENATAVIIDVTPGSSVNTIIDQLVSEGLLNTPFWFKVYGRLAGKAQSLQAGNFEIYPGTNIRELYEILVDAHVAERKVTILEGWTLRDLDAMLVERGIAQEDEVMQLAKDATIRADYPFLNQIPRGLDLEGYVFPETYRVFANANAEDVLRKALDTFQERIVDAKAGSIQKNTRSLFEIVTIASILEREVRRPEDMRLVADLIERRLALGMPLQMDSTVNYATGKSDPGVTFVDRDTPSPYNTYLNPGLPVGPISNPSEEAIDAVLSPTPNDYLYFLTTPEGEVVYARTHDEHLRNRVRYL
ncbi:hypothetical protein COV06_02455 [Candidatus Uhrbacteria bacterium CG10_big_fil_rev_8_21_14_0_10_50_16]|uniref:Endolytic murein transglycosylase n=1 Tax=Candidatus Uhrbacteria bacterium CG10_big_fil_rev_8_21_14_0_10_50_16 TaxID=1975039 RepID=A0A2H0RMC8_9BACT|nr:MAG: hypothetical protein COV06_02455 [Candidatus Uhrbacteria bacterium CG10_big_fil_rev_8_21_14_0_10_50_16]